MRSRIFSFCLLMAFASQLNAQLVIDETMTPQQLVENVLLGGGVTVSNVTFNGVPSPGFPQIGAGSFTYAGGEFGLAGGMVLATGALAGIPQPAAATMGDQMFLPGDPDLDLLTNGGSTSDATIIEFDFVPTGDLISFRYVFSSEEYPEFVCSPYNDVFGFFVSGPGILGPFSNNSANIALLPASTIPIAINTVNSGVVGTYWEADVMNCDAADPNWQANTIYYDDNTAGTHIVFNGGTIVMEASQVVECGATYHIKIAVADTDDGDLDSAVFLEAGSFASNTQVTAELAGGAAVNGDTIFQGCGSVDITFSRTENIDQPETVDLTAAGTATAGVDYDPLFPANITFAAGESVITLTINVPADVDPQETLILTVGEELCPGSMSNVFTFYIDSPEPLTVTMDDVVGGCVGDVVIGPVVTGGVGPYEYLWNTAETTSEITVAAAGQVEVTVSDACGSVPVSATAMVSFDIEQLAITMSADVAAQCGETVDLWVETVQGGDGAYVYEWTVNGAFVDVQDYISVVVAGAAYYVVTVTDGCGTSVQDSVQVTLLDPLVLDVEATPDAFLPCNGQVQIEVLTVSGGTGNYTYEWSLAGTVVGNAMQHMATETGTYDVLVTDDCGNSGTAQVEVSPDEPLPLVIDVDPEAILPCTGWTQVAVNSVDGGTAPYSYAWTLDGTSVGNTASIQANATGWYILTVEDVCGASLQDSVQVNYEETEPIAITLSPDLLLPCQQQGQVSVLSVTGGTIPHIYLWTVNGTSYSSNPTATAIAVTPTWYVATVTDNCGGFAQDSILVEAITADNIIINTAPAPSVLCPGDIAAMEVTGVFGGYDPMVLEWTEPDGQLAATGMLLDVSLAETTTYTISATDICGNTGDTTITATLLFDPAIEVRLPADLTICAGEEVELLAEVNGGSGYFHIEWVGLELTDPSLTVVPENTTTYSINIYDQCGPMVSDQVEVTVEHVVMEIKDLSMGQDDWFLMAETSPQAITWIWDMGDGKRYRTPTVLHSYLDLEEHWVTLDITTQTGCIGRDSILIHPSAHIYFPNAFTPDGDGNNEEFGAVGHSIDVYQLLIFDRWGEVVFTSDDMTRRWDGTVGGDQAQTGVYIYKYRAEGHFVPLVEGTGHVTLLRGDWEQ